MNCLTGLFQFYSMSIPNCKGMFLYSAISRVVQSALHFTSPTDLFTRTPFWLCVRNIPQRSDLPTFCLEQYDIKGPVKTHDVVHPQSAIIIM